MFEIVLTAVATFGVSATLTGYDGPFELFSKFRALIPLFQCTVCLSVWIAMPIAIIVGVGIIEYLAALGLIVLAERLT